MLDPTNPFAAHIAGERAMTETTKKSDIEKGKDSLRYLLNWAEDSPRTRLETVLDKTKDGDGVTTREQLEALWRSL